jgi:integrase
MAPDRLTRLYTKLLTEHGLLPIRLHDLRHGAATLALAAGVELKVVQEMLGHSSIVLTAGTYTLRSGRGRAQGSGEDRRPRPQSRPPRPGNQSPAPSHIDP